MTYFLKRLLLFSVPFALYGLFIRLTDPFNFLGRHSMISTEVKMRTAYPLNYCLWEMPLFAKHPNPNLLLGDSRMAGLKSERIKELTGEDYFNLAYGGATLREIVSSFWFASRYTRLDHVYIGLDFNLYTDYEQLDRTAEVNTIESAPACYFINRTVLRAAVYGVAGQLFHYDPKIGAVTADRNTFWKLQLGPTTEGFYVRHVYPRRFHAKLEEIAQFVKRQGGEVVFVIFPTHVDLQNRVKDFGLEGEYARFKRDVGSLGTTYDFDYPNALTANADNFSDPYHCGHECVDEIIREIWSGDFKYARRLTLGT
jgi:hypothetical protein